MANTPTPNNHRFSNIATDPLRNFKFIAEFTAAHDHTFDDTNIVPTVAGGFTSITGLGINTQSIPYREGGYNTTIHQIPGMTTFTPITFQHGALNGSYQGIKWMRGLFAAAQGEGIAITPGTDFRVNVKIYILDHPVQPISDTADLVDNAKMRFDVHNAWITTLQYSDLNAGDQNILFEQMTLVHEGLSVGFMNGNQVDTNTLLGMA
jgi:phage tail-like protein